MYPVACGMDNDEERSCSQRTTLGQDLPPAPEAPPCAAPPRASEPGCRPLAIFHRVAKASSVASEAGDSIMCASDTGRATQDDSPATRLETRSMVRNRLTCGCRTRGERSHLLMRRSRLTIAASLLAVAWLGSWPARGIAELWCVGVAPRTLSTRYCSSPGRGMWRQTAAVPHRCPDR